MKTKMTAALAIMAVAVVALAGAGYAAYWGQTEIANNAVASKYISVASDDERINADIQYDSLYSKSNTDAYASYKIIPSDYETKGGAVGFETGVGTANTYNLVPLYTQDSDGDNLLETKAYTFTLTSPESMIAGSYDFQVTLSGIDANIGSKVTIYFAYEAHETELGASTVLYPFYKTDVAGTYVAVVSAPAVTTATEGTEAGYSNTYDGYIFAGIAGTNEEKTGEPAKEYCKLSAGTAAPDVTPNAAKLKVTAGTLQFQAIVDEVATTSVSGAIISVGGAVADLKGFTVTGVAAIPTTPGKVAVATTGTDDNAYKVTLTGDADTYTVVLKFASGDDVFYRVVSSVTVSA